MNDLENLKPFDKFCHSIGYIPTSYKVSMTYEEQLIWFCDFLQNEVVPVVNNNSAVVEQLKNYMEHYFDDLNVQEEINNKLDEMASDGTLAEIINEQIFSDLNDKIEEVDNKTPFSQLVDTSIFAQISPTMDLSGYAFSGFAIGEEICLACCQDNSHDNTAKIFAYNITSGQLIDYLESQTIGHANDITYCDKDECFYIACGGGSNGINTIAKYKIINNTLTYIASVNMAGFNMGGTFAICYDKENENFYCGIGNYLAKLDYNLSEVLDYKEFVENSNYVMQSLFFYEGYILNVINILNSLDIYANYNKLDIYNSNLDYVESSNIMLLGEIEAGDFYNNEFYLMKQTQSSGILVRANVIKNNNSYSWINNNIVYNNRIPTTGSTNEYYVTKSATNFFVDGSSELPFKNLLVCLGFINNNRNSVKIHIDGDFSDKEISLGNRQFLNTLELIGTSTDMNNLSKIGGLNLCGLRSLNVQNLEITKRTGASNNLINLEQINYCYMNNIKFNGQGTELNGLRCIGSNVYLGTCIFDSSFQDQNIYMAGNSFIYCNGTVTVNNSNVLQLSTHNKKLWYQTPISLFTEDNTWNTNVIGGNITFNIKDLKMEGDYRVESGNTMSDAPTGYTTTACRINVNAIHDAYIYTFVPINTNKLYKGIRSGTQTSITWEEII